MYWRVLSWAEKLRHAILNITSQAVRVSTFFWVVCMGVRTRMQVCDLYKLIFHYYIRRMRCVIPEVQISSKSFVFMLSWMDYTMPSPWWQATSHLSLCILCAPTPNAVKIHFLKKMGCHKYADWLYLCPSVNVRHKLLVGIMLYGWWVIHYSVL